MLYGLCTMYAYRLEAAGHRTAFTAVCYGKFDTNKVFPSVYQRKRSKARAHRHRMARLVLFSEDLFDPLDLAVVPTSRNRLVGPCTNSDIGLYYFSTRVRIRTFPFAQWCTKQGMTLTAILGVPIL